MSTPTAFAQIVGAIKAALEDTPAVSERVYRGRTRPMDAEWPDMVNIRLDTATRERFAIQDGPADWDTTLIIECTARSTIDAPDLAIDALMHAAHNRLQLDTTLDGLVMDLDLKSLEFTFDEDAEKTGTVAMTYMVLHRTDSTTLE